MKKSILLAAVVAAGSLFTSCNGGAGSSDLKTDVDTITYELGMAASPGEFLVSYLQRMGCDSTDVAEYLKGFKDGMKTDDSKTAYNLGMQHGMQTKTQMLANVAQQVFGEGSAEKLNDRVFLQAFIDQIEGNTKLFVDTVKVTQQMAQMDVQQRIEKRVEEREALEYAPNLQAGQDFLAAKAQEEGVVALANGVLYKEIKAGKVNGKKPALTDKIKVAYKGTLIDGTEFDSSNEVEFPLNNMIEGWKIAIPEMTEGSKWEIYIPQELAYGKRGSMPTIKPYSALIFEVELFEIVTDKKKK
ncbi:MAG: FKBP-type peptidyl-prolyl cis-trans isomerase [Bacteroidaceae bacterium]|jgi:FKBP-type peptidyl-prolyl cis-trans isomerase FklB|nr:FKBP-type peptidyl-prolyl cis-trans isomerase [Bacteroidaceae bacterium]